MGDGQDISGQAIRSGAWLFARRIAGNLIRLIAVAILARRLSPAEFGLVALAQVVLGFAVLAGDNGLGTFVIYDRKEGWEGRVHSAFWLNAALNLVQLILIGLVIPIAGHFYASPALPAFLTTLAFAFFVRQLAAVPEALLRKQMRFREIVVRDTSCDLLASCLSVALALGGAGAWSLVLPALVVEPIRTAVVFSLARWWPRASLGFSDWRRIAGYSLNLLGANLLSLVTNDADTLLVGKLFGSRTVGFYNLAWQLSNLLGKNITGIVGAVGMSALAVLNASSQDRFRAGYLRLLHALAMVCCPAIFGMFVLSDDLIRLAYGPGWEQAVPLLRLFLVFTLLRSVTSPTGTIYNVTGRTDVSFRITIAVLPFYLCGILVGSRFGPIGVATGVVAIRGLCAVADLAISTWLVELTFGRVLQVLLPSVLLAAGMAGVVWWANQGLIAGHVHLIVRLLVSTALGCGLYMTGIFFFDPRAWAEAIHLVSRLAPRRGKVAPRGVQAGS